MNNFHALVHDEQKKRKIVACNYRNAVVQLHRDCIREQMLNRIVMFAADKEFNIIVDSLAPWLEISRCDAVDLLWSESHRIYKAAETARVE